MNRGATSSRAKAMRGRHMTKSGADLAQSLKADLLTSLNAIGRQGDEGGLEVPCPIAPPMISPVETQNQESFQESFQDVPHGMDAMCMDTAMSDPTAMSEHNVHGHSVHGGNAAWWDTPVESTKSWCAQPDCLELLQRPGQSCVDLLQRPPQQPAQDCVELLQRSPADCVEVFRAQKQGRQIPRQIPPRQYQALSANAPEFVPEGSSIVIPATMQYSMRPQCSTSVQESMGGLLPQDEAANVKSRKPAYAPPTLPVTKSMDPDSMCCSLTSSTAAPPMNQPPDANSGAGSSEDAEVQKQTDKEELICITVEDLPDHIPSIGSLKHDSGDCRRCNFFHKGRCQNARSCTFCHFPHEKRKTARKDEQLDSIVEESASIQITHGAPGLDLPTQLTPRTVQFPLGSRPVKVSTGTQTEDDLPPCLLCCEPPSVEEMVPPKTKVMKKGMKEEKGPKEDNSGHQGTARVARIGGC